MLAKTKYVIIVGGVYSGIGKGIASASIALLMSFRSHKVTCIKLDPYLNTSASVLSPQEHGEVWVTEDGAETDLDLGSYERIAGIPISVKNICTSGNIYKELIEEQEQGLFLGQTLQMATHFSEKVKNRIVDVGAGHDICVVEIGGTIGDCESFGFYEGIRQFKQEQKDDCIIVLVAPVIWANTIKEFKTKPLQNAVKSLQMYGLQPDILMCRSEKHVPSKILDKISALTNVHRNAIFDAPDVKSTYQVPIELYDRQLDDLIVDKFKLKRNGCRISKYKELVENYLNGHSWPTVNIGIVCKYGNCDEAYLSLKEAITHASIANNTKFTIRWINAEDLEGGQDNRSLWRHFHDLSGVIVPGGFDVRGIEGKVRAISYVREKKIPFLGICLGLQCAVIEFARNVLGIADATSEEFDKNASNKVIHYLPGQENLTKKTGTMRLGSYDCELDKDSLVFGLYKRKNISERHRHRYEVNQTYLDALSAKGLKVCGHNPGTNLVEMMELSDHPFFVGTQAHPEFQSRLGAPSPLFSGLVAAALKKSEVKKIETPPESLKLPQENLLAG